jgi:hypothetical protein
MTELAMSTTLHSASVARACQVRDYHLLDEEPKKIEEEDIEELCE